MADNKDKDLELDNLLWELNDIAGTAGLDEDDQEIDEDDDFDNFNFVEGEELTGFPISPSKNEDTVLSSPVKKKTSKRNSEKTRKRKSQVLKDQARTRRKSKDPLEALRKFKPVDRRKVSKASYELIDPKNKELLIEKAEIPKSSSPWLDPTTAIPSMVNNLPVSPPNNPFGYTDHPGMELDDFEINHVESLACLQPQKKIVRMGQRQTEKTPVKTKKSKSLLRPKTAPTKQKNRGFTRSKSFQTPSPRQPGISRSSSTSSKTKRRRHSRGRVNSYTRSSEVKRSCSANKDPNCNEVRPYGDCGPSFGTARNSRLGKVEKSSAPGPGHYYKYTGFCTSHQSSASTFGASNRFGRKRAQSASNSPGPGHYTARRPVKTNAGKSFSLSKSKRFQKKLDKRPSPGQYSDRIFRTNNQMSGGHSFSRCARMPVKKLNGSPGPGSYSSSTHLLNHDRLFVTYRKTSK